MELDNEYKNWLSELKLKIRSAQMKAAIAVNQELILFYWDLGNMLSDKIKTSNWGAKVLENVSKDLKAEFPQMKGFSVTNLKYCKLFYEYFQISPQLGDQLNSIKNTISQQAVDQLQDTEHQENIKSQHAVDQIENEQTINRSQAVNQNRNFSIIQQLVAQIPWGSYYYNNC